MRARDSRGCGRGAPQRPVRRLGHGSQLVDSGAQGYVHPQRMLMGGTRIVSYGTWEAAGFAFLPVSQFATFALAQASNASYGYSGAPRTFQGGLACGTASVRVGAAYREGHTKEASASHAIRIETGETRDEENREHESLREIAAGMGFSRGRASVDLSAEVARLERETFLGRRESFDTQESSLEIDGRTLWGATLFAALPLSGRDILRVVGAFRDRRADVKLHATLVPYAPIDFVEELYGHAWNAGLAFEHDLGDGRFGRFHAHYSDARDPGGSRGYSDLYVTSERMQVAETGLSLQRPGWWGETLYLGVYGALLRKSTESTYVSSYELRFRSGSVDRYAHAFSWGASRSFGDLDLVGLVGGNLSLGSTFAAIDATFRL